MQLDTYISDLLYRYECVTIPEFGSFLTRRVSASIIEDTNTFYPPKKVISFNEQIQKNDGLLAHYIADIEKIPFETANKKIAKRVRILKSFLTQGETLTFKNVGDIIFNNEGKILFEPTYGLNYLTDSFGLSQFASLSVTREIYKEKAEAIEKVIPITVTPEKRKARPYFKYAAVALIALTVGGFGASNYYVNQIQIHNQLAQEEAAQQLDTQIQQATFSLSTLPAITLNVTKQSGNYHIIAGAFRVEENSDKKIKQLRDLGYNARSIGINKYGLYEVVYASYENGSEALKAINIIRNTHNKDAWLKVDSETKNTKVSYNSISSNIKSLEEKSEKNIKTSEVVSKRQANSSTEKVIDLNYSPNIIQIIRGVESVENGYYLVLGVYSDLLKRDAFIKYLTDSGLKNVAFFYHSESGNYFIYNETYNNIEAAQKSLKSDSNLRFKGKVGIIKIDN